MKESATTHTHAQICCIISIHIKGRGNVTLKMKPHNTDRDNNSTTRFAFKRTVEFQCLITARPLQDEASEATEFQQLRVCLTPFLIWTAKTFSQLLSGNV